jgi:hypothetical protein
MLRYVSAHDIRLPPVVFPGDCDGRIAQDVTCLFESLRVAPDLCADIALGRPLPHLALFQEATNEAFQIKLKLVVRQVFGSTYGSPSPVQNSQGAMSRGLAARHASQAARRPVSFSSSQVNICFLPVEFRVLTTCGRPSPANTSVTSRTYSLARKLPDVGRP